MSGHPNAMLRLGKGPDARIGRRASATAHHGGIGPPRQSVRRRSPTLSVPRHSRAGPYGPVAFPAVPAEGAPIAGSRAGTHDFSRHIGGNSVLDAIICAPVCEEDRVAYRS